MPAERLDLIHMQDLEQAAECLRALAHPIRLRLLDILQQGEFPVGKLAEMVELPSHQASEHLRLLQRHGLLSSRRCGRQVLYVIEAPQLPGLLKCIRENCQCQPQSMDL